MSSSCFNSMSFSSRDEVIPPFLSPITCVLEKYNDATMKWSISKLCSQNLFILDLHELRPHAHVQEHDHN